MDFSGDSVWTVSAIVTGVLLLALAVWLWSRSRGHQLASEKAKKVFPLWASQGHFNTGAESAAALRNAFLAVSGPEKTEEMADAIAKHEASYDDQPEKWEKLRREVMKPYDSNRDDNIDLAVAITAAEAFNKENLEHGGHRLELTKQPDGRVGFNYRQIWSNEAVAEEKTRNNVLLASGVGKGLLEDSSKEAQALVAFLSDVYRATSDEKPDATAIGRSWFACMSFCNEEPDSEFSSTFRNLNDAHLATIPDDEADITLDDEPDIEGTGEVPGGGSPERHALRSTSLTLIDKMLANPEISEDFRVELEGYRTDIFQDEFDDRFQGEFGDSDHQNIQALYKRTTGAEDCEK